MAVGEAVVKEVAGDLDVVLAIGLDEVEAALFVPLQGLQAVG